MKYGIPLELVRGDGIFFKSVFRCDILYGMSYTENIAKPV